MGFEIIGLRKFSPAYIANTFVHRIFGFFWGGLKIQTQASSNTLVKTYILSLYLENFHFGLRKFSPAYIANTFVHRIFGFFWGGLKIQTQASSNTLVKTYILSLYLENFHFGLRKFSPAYIANTFVHRIFGIFVLGFKIQTQGSSNSL